MPMFEEIESHCDNPPTPPQLLLIVLQLCSNDSLNKARPDDNKETDFARHFLAEFDNQTCHAHTHMYSLNHHSNQLQYLLLRANCAVLVQLTLKQLRARTRTTRSPFCKPAILHPVYSETIISYRDQGKSVSPHHCLRVLRSPLQYDMMVSDETPVYPSACRRENGYGFPDVSLLIA